MDSGIPTTTDSQAKSNALTVWFLVLGIILLALIGGLLYVWQITSKEVRHLGLRINSLQQEKSKIEQELATALSEVESLRQELLNAENACFHVPDCTQERARILRRAFLGSAGLVDVVSRTQREGLSYYEYLFELSDKELPDKLADFLPPGLRQFMEVNCLADMRDVNTTMSNRYDSVLADGRVASIVMDGELRKITCAWIYDASTDAYAPIRIPS